MSNALQRLLRVGGGVLVVLALVYAGRWSCHRVPGGHPVDAGYPTRATPLGHQVYIWQRQWTPSLKAALQAHAHHFDRLVVLGAEISFTGGQPRVVRTEADYALLKDLRVPLGIALRLGPYTGPFVPDDSTSVLIGNVAAGLTRQARAAGITPVEFQIDFDCATSRLADFQRWVAALRPRVGVPLTFTALPTWLDSDAFPELARAADGYVLQVHSLEKPADIHQSISLCDPTAALAAVAQAGALDLPFRVALPTYGYRLFFDKEGAYGGLSAEQLTTLSPGTRTRDVHADPAEMARLLQLWGQERPATMRGVIWYRFPVPGDSMNWQWVTLERILQGQVPRATLAAMAARTQPGLWEIGLLNSGDADAELHVSLTAVWRAGAVVAADAFRGFEGQLVSSNRFQFMAAAPVQSGTLPPGARQAVGWLRLSGNEDIQVDVLPIEP